MPFPIIIALVILVFIILASLAIKRTDDHMPPEPQPKPQRDPSRAPSNVPVLPRNADDDIGIIISIDATSTINPPPFRREKPLRKMWRPAPPMPTVYLDTETTGLYGRFGNGKDEVVEIAICDDFGTPLVNSLVRPNRATFWPQAQKIHGITPEMVADAPRIASLLPAIRKAVAGRRVVIYNRKFDVQFLPPSALIGATEIRCCMTEYADYASGWNKHYGNYQWVKLVEAAKHVGHEWGGNAHRSLPDALAARSVWQWLQSPDRALDVAQE